jgi:hypothetical protein
MSYSFIVRAADKTVAKRQVAAELAKVVKEHPNHLIDRAQAQATAYAFIDLLPTDKRKNIQVNVHGSVNVSGAHEAMNLTSAAVGVCATLTLRPEGEES